MIGLAAAQRSYDRQEPTGRTWSEMTDEEQAADHAETLKDQRNAASAKAAASYVIDPRWEAVTAKRLAQQNA